jgi:hypothetical protein
VFYGVYNSRGSVVGFYNCRGSVLVFYISSRTEQQEDPRGARVTSSQNRRSRERKRDNTSRLSVSSAEPNKALCSLTG